MEASGAVGHGAKSKFLAAISMIEVLLFYGVIFGFIIWASVKGESKMNERNLVLPGPDAAQKKQAESLLIQFLEESLNSFQDNRVCSGYSGNREHIQILHAWYRSVAIRDLYQEEGVEYANEYMVFSWISILLARMYQRAVPAKMRVPVGNSAYDLEQILKKFRQSAGPYEHPYLPMPDGEPMLYMSDSTIKYYRRRELHKMAINLPACGCVYIGTESVTGKTYVGQTTNSPEYRWNNHRQDSTGPFKGGSTNVNWEVLKKNIALEELDYWESFYIGFTNSFGLGLNSNHGEDREGYNAGCSARLGSEGS